MNKLVVVCFGFFLLAYYYFVLRKYNTLGFRLFSLCFFIGCFGCYWWYTSDRDLKNVQHTGVATDALVPRKTPNALRVRFTDPITGQVVERTQEGGISVEEFMAVSEGQPALILYTPGSGHSTWPAATSANSMTTFIFWCCPARCFSSAPAA